MNRRSLLALPALALACKKPEPNMNALAQRYVKLVLGIGHHDPSYVDAYYGPAEWKPAKQPLAELKNEAAALKEAFESEDWSAATRQSGRLDYLLAQTSSALVRIEMLEGRKMSFDEEAKALYQAAPPPYRQSQFTEAIGLLDKSLPGKGDVQPRYSAFEARFNVPAARLERAFRAAINEARRRTKEHVPDLPANENFTVEYVKGKAWSAYNWYKGNAQSLIQVNIEQPISIDRLLHLACHEGYPGHHVYNALLEQKLVKASNWPEFSVYALFSPQSLIAEGTADFGNSLVLPDRERLTFKREVLFPEAGLEPNLAAEQQEIQNLARPLRHVPIEAARAYLDGRFTAAQTVQYLQEFGLQTKPMAERRVRFFDENRSYIINYSFGEDLVSNWVLRNAGVQDESRWTAFLNLLMTPQTPAKLL